MFWISKGIREFAAAMIANPHDWIQGPYEFINKNKTDLRIWTSNGLFFVQIGGLSGLSLFEKAYILAAVKLTNARRLTTPEKGE